MTQSTLFETIKADQQAARRETPPDKLKIAALTSLIDAAAKKGESPKAPARPPTDAEVVAVIKATIANAQANLTHAPAGTPFHEANVAEIAAVEGYLPKQMTDDEVKATIAILADQSTSLTINTIMAHFKTNFPGQYDGKMVSTLAREAITAG